MISVIIPTCRRPDLLARCLDRLAPGVQSLPADRYEVIVTDDGEPTVERLVTERYPWATWVAGSRRGPAANRNNGARRARGEWLAFTDDDCLPAQDWLSAFTAAVHSGAQVYEGKTTCDAGLRSPLMQAPINLTGGCLWSCNMMISAAAFSAVGGFDEMFPYPHLEDSDLRERLAAAGWESTFVPAAVVDHPPRRQATGWRLGRYHQSWVYWWYKGGRKTFGGPRLIWLLVRIRAKNLFGFPFGLDTIRAAGSVAAEFTTLLVRLPVWEWQYRRRFLTCPLPKEQTLEPGPRYD